ncbi:MAG: DUF2062 domain-containing protein [Pseudomonadota bacterium]
MFKRRKPLTWMQSVGEFFYPRSGWRRAIEYVKIRLKRLPDTPHRIAVGISCGVFVSFSPLFGFHFFVSALFAWILRGNILASLLATFVGNPITFPFIAAASHRIGLWLMGRGSERQVWGKVSDGFGEMFSTLWINFKSIFVGGGVPWDPMQRVFHDVFLPYLIGGIIPGAVFAVIFYVASRPMIEAYQKRRKGALMRKFQEMRAKRKAQQESKP